MEKDAEEEEMDELSSVQVVTVITHRESSPYQHILLARGERHGVFLGLPFAHDLGKSVRTDAVVAVVRQHGR